MRTIAILKSQIAKGGGAEKYALAVAKALQTKGYAVTLLTTGPKPENTGLAVVSHNKKSPFSFRNVAAFDAFCTEYLKAHPHEHVFSFDRNRKQSIIRASNGVHASFLKHRNEGMLKSLSYRLNPLHRLLLKIEKQGFEDPDLKTIIANSYLVKNEIVQTYNVSPDKIKVVHNGVEWQEMQADFDNWENVPRKPHVFHFLFIGHNFERKGLTRVLNALSQMRGKEFHLSVIGKEKNLKSFEKLVSALNLKHQVSFLGPKADTRAYYQMADCLIIPSLYDPFANVTVEALAMGLFVVSSKTNGGHEVLTPETGVVIEDSLQEALLKAMERPKTKQSALKIRNSVAHLDFSKQLPFLISECGL